MKAPIPFAILAAFALSVTGCTAGNPTFSGNLETALAVATSLEAAYAARPHADPKVVAEMIQQLAAGRAAVAAWEMSSSTADQAAADAVIAALVAYEASAQLPPKS